MNRRLAPVQEGDGPDLLQAQIVGVGEKKDDIRVEGKARPEGRKMLRPSFCLDLLQLCRCNRHLVSKVA